jgi:hypothetical protein
MRNMLHSHSVMKILMTTLNEQLSSFVYQVILYFYYFYFSFVEIIIGIWNDITTLVDVGHI